jgi:hypothetical protein
MPLSALLAWGTMTAARIRRHGAPAAALVVLAVLSCGAALATAPGPSRAVPLDAVRVSARRAPAFGFQPASRRDDAVLRSQPEVQTLGVGTTLARARLARLQGDRIRRLAAATARHRLGFQREHQSGRPSSAAAPRLRAPPSPG